MVLTAQLAQSVRQEQTELMVLTVLTAQLAQKVQ